MFGGVIGTILGGMLAVVISRFTPIPASIEPWSVALGIGITAVVCLFFGLCPAMRGAPPPSIGALRRGRSKPPERPPETRGMLCGRCVLRRLGRWYFSSSACGELLA